MSEATAVRERLVQACRILALEGQGDRIWGHVTARVPGRSDLLFMKPATIGLEEIGVDDVITVNLDGEKVGVVNLHDVTERRHAEHRLVKGMEGAVAAIAAAAELRDPYTAGHERRVADLAGVTRPQ